MTKDYRDTNKQTALKSSTMTSKVCRVQNGRHQRASGNYYVTLYCTVYNPPFIITVGDTWPARCELASYVLARPTRTVSVNIHS